MVFLALTGRKKKTKKWQIFSSPSFPKAQRKKVPAVVLCLAAWTQRCYSLKCTHMSVWGVPILVKREVWLTDPLNDEFLSVIPKVQSANQAFNKHLSAWVEWRSIYLMKIHCISRCHCCCSLNKGHQELLTMCHMLLVKGLFPEQAFLIWLRETIGWFTLGRVTGLCHIHFLFPGSETTKGCWSKYLYPERRCLETVTTNSVSGITL